MKYWCRIILLLLIVYSIAVTQTPDTLWTRTYGGVNLDVATSVIQLSDGGYILAGYTESYGAGQLDIWIIRTGIVGDTIWSKTFGGSGDDVPFELIETQDSCYVVVATTWSWGEGDIWVLKIDYNGDTLWTKRHGGPDDDWGYSIKQTYEGDYIITGTTCTYDPAGDIYLLKLDSLGDTLWSRIYDSGSTDESYFVANCFDSGFVLAGFTMTNNLYVFAMKVDNDGDSVWTTTLNAGWAYVIRELSDSCFAIACRADNELGLIKLDQQGDSLWCEKYGIGRAYDVIEIENDGYTLVGRDASGASWDLTVIRTDDIGQVTWSRDYGGAGSDEAEALCRTSDGGYIIAGRTSSFGSGSSDFWLLKMSYDPSVHEHFRNNLCKQYPFCTMFTGPLQLPVNKPYKIFDITGRQIHTLNPAPGIYFIEVDGKIRQKVVKVR